MILAGLTSQPPMIEQVIEQVIEDEIYIEV
jgi:hypothetical protein